MYGVLKSSVNTGSDNELLYVFSTPLNINSNQPAYVSDTMSLKRRVSSQNVQRWEIEAQIAQTNDSPNLLIHTTEKGFSDIFYLRMPQVFRSTPIPETLNLTTASVKQIGSRNIDIAGLNGNDITGHFINFSGNSKVYLVTSVNSENTGSTITFNNLRINSVDELKINAIDKLRVNLLENISNGVAQVNVSITPPLLTAVASNTGINYGNKTTMAARYDANTILGIRYSDGILVNQGSMKFIEAL